MKKVRHIATFADLLILAIVVIINPTSPITPYRPFKAPCVSDKVEVHYTKALSTDSLTQSLKNTEAQLSEMKYYLKVHNVTDEGYNQVAHYNQTLLDRKDWLQRIFELSAANRLPSPSSQTITIPAKDRPLIAVKLSKGHWHAGHFTFTPLYGKALTRDYQGRIVSAVYVADTVVSAIRIDSAGVYQGQVDSYLQANGQGTYLANNGEYYEGHWQNDHRNGFGFLSSPYMQLKAGEWKNGKFLGERLRYTSERIYGIDISQDMKVLATKNNARAVAEERMQLRVGNVEQMPYDDGFFDCVYTINTLYFWKDAGRAMDETVRVLKDGGRFICAFYSKAYFERSEKYQYEGETYYTTGELKELAAAHGLEKVKVKVVDEKKFMYCLIGEKRGNGIVEDSADE